MSWISGSIPLRKWKSRWDYLAELHEYNTLNCATCEVVVDDIVHVLNVTSIIA